MLSICVRPERVCPKLSSIQGIRANLVYIVSLDFAILTKGNRTTYHKLLTSGKLFINRHILIYMGRYTKSLTE